MAASVVLVLGVAAAVALYPIRVTAQRPETGVELVQIAAAPPPGSRIARVGADVTVGTGLHVYAPGNPGYVAVDIELEPVEGMRPRKLHLPEPTELLFNLSEPVLVYERPFRVVRDVQLSAAQRRRPLADGLVTLKGRLRYQACTDTVCLRPVTRPLTWTITKQQYDLPAPATR